jgi:GNAT superfamily N-acetyltransferase
MPVVVRTAIGEEAVALTALARRAKAQWGYPSHWLVAWEDQLTITPTYIHAHRVYAAQLDERLVGVCALEDRGQSWALEHLWVDPAHQRIGVGRALVTRALDEVRRVRPGIVTVTSDPNAAGFYERLGARSVGAVRAPMLGAPERTLPLFEFVMTS